MSTIDSLNDDDIREIELELTGICNINCPLCMCNMECASHLVGKPNILPIDKWISILSKYKNTTDVFFAGNLSEPTLYPYLFDLIDYLHGRGIAVELYTNGMTHCKDWWRELSLHMKQCDKCEFTICGSTQELHGKYRVGSKLDTILENAAAFREIGNHNDWVQHIRFKYNQEDLALGNMDYIFRQFSHKALIDSNAYNERFNIVDDVGLNIPDCIHDKYMSIMRYGLSRMDQPCHLICKSLDTKFISFDQFGNESPCFLYRIYEKTPFTHHDYSRILNNRRHYCFECEKNTKRLLELANIDLIM